MKRKRLTKKQRRQRRQEIQWANKQISRKLPYSEYLWTTWWRSKRKQKIHSVGGRCERCGHKGRLQVHHKHYRTLWREKLSDLEALCKDCRMWEHRGIIEMEQHLDSLSFWRYA